MKQPLAILAIALLAIAGAWYGHWLGKPEPGIAPRAPVAQEFDQKRRTAVELVSLLNSSKAEATSYSLRRELEELPFAELGAAFEELAKADAKETHLNNRELRLVLDILTARDPEATIALVRENFSQLKRSHAYYTIIEQWGRADPEATLRFLTTLDKDEDPTSHIHNATTGFLYGWATDDPRAALEAWFALPDPKLPDPGTVSYGSECLALGAAQSPEMRETALQMLLDQPDSTARTSAIVGVLKNWTASGSFAEVTAWFEAQILPPESATQIAIGIGSTAAQAGNNTAAAWVVEQVFANEESPSDRSNLLAEFAEEWARELPNECADWLETLDPSTETDWAIRGFLRQVEYQDPASGFQWTRRISEPALRQRISRELWNAWRRQAPVSAQEFIPSLEPEERDWLGL